MVLVRQCGAFDSLQKFLVPLPMPLWGVAGAAEQVQSGQNKPDGGELLALSFLYYPLPGTYRRGKAGCGKVGRMFRLHDLRKPVPGQKCARDII